MRVRLALALISILAAASEASAQAQKGNHYLCYVVEKESGASQIPVSKVKDQFGGANAILMKPRYVCNPASVNGKPVADAQVHIVCYEATTSLRSEARKVLVRNEFTSDSQLPHLELGAVQLVCVPSLKKRD